MKKNSAQLAMAGGKRGCFWEEEERKACENDGMVVKERGEIFYPSHEHPGKSGSRVYQNGTGQNPGCYVWIGGVFNGPGQKNACDTALVLVS